MRAGWGGHSPGEVYVSAPTVCAKTFFTYIRVTVPTANVLVADVFGTGSFDDICCQKTCTSLKPCASLFLRLTPLPHPESRKIKELHYCPI